MLGIDLFGRYNLITDWRRIRDDGIEAVFVKTTNGAWPASPPADTYVAGAHSVRCRVGGYHYALPGSPATQAAVFASELRRLAALDLAPALDFEDATLPGASAARRVWIEAFFTALKAQLPGLTRVLLYSSGAELAAIGAGSILVLGLDVAVWDAEYGANDGLAHPIVHYTGAAAMHQYTSEGRLPGASGPVDLDEVAGDIAATDSPWIGGDPVAFGCYPPATDGHITLGVPEVGIHCAKARLTLTSGWADTGTCTVWAIAGVKQYLHTWSHFGVGQDNPWIAELPAGTTQISIAYTSSEPLGVSLDVDK